MTIETITPEMGAQWIDATGASIDRDVIERALVPVQRELSKWIDNVRGAARASLLNRAAYANPQNPFAQMATAKSIVENDDVVSGAADVTEALIFQGLKWESEDPTTTEIFNKIARDLNLDQFARQWHREDFTYSHAVVGFWWGRREYEIEGPKRRKKVIPEPADPTDEQAMADYKAAVAAERRKPGPKRKKTVATPVAMTYLDPNKVVPLTPGPFGQERLAWHASEGEFADALAMAETGSYGDPVLREFTNGPVTGLSLSERTYVEQCGMDYRRLLWLNPYNVIRFSRTKMPYERFSPVRLKSIFQLIDLKQQMMEADRAHIVGAANFLLLVRQGSDQLPAKQEEIDNLNEKFSVLAKLPVVVGDHRLSIDIITPDQEWVLNGDKYDTIDRRLIARCLGALSLSGSGQRNESTVTVARGIARLLESRRHGFKRYLEEHLARAVVEHPDNKGIFGDEPNLVFTPRNVQLDSDAEVARAVLALRTQKELSRETTLEYFGFDQTIEALRRTIEEEEYDDIFQTAVPFDSPDNQAGSDQTNGQQGGRPAGGGDSPQSPAGQTGGTSDNGNKST